VRAWSCPAEGRVKVAAGKGRPAPGLPAGVGGVTVTVPVAAIACDTPLMNDHLRETLNAAAHADIVYELTDYTMTGPDTAHATGTLTVNGVTKPMALDVKLASSPQGVRATGETTIDMTQYGVTPPAVFDGMLKVGKDVRVKFDAVLPAR
jgi:polyisoprenoid-binding protein YceI